MRLAHCPTTSQRIALPLSVLQDWLGHHSARRSFASSSAPALNAINLANSLQDVSVEPSLHDATLIGSVDQCLNLCDPTPGADSSVLTYLHNLCVNSLVVPTSYWVTDVSRGRRLAAGGEAAVHEGISILRAVAIRDFHPPIGGGWSSDEGRRIIKVATLSHLLHSVELIHPRTRT